MQHVMVDLETMGTGIFAPILSIGAVKFDPLFPDDWDEDDTPASDTFQVFISLDSNIKVGLRPEADTIGWWLDPNQHDARMALHAGQVTAVNLDEALIGFADWFGDDKPIWGNGATFDNVVLSNAYQATGLDKPWTYKSDRCFRTIRSLKVPSDPPEFVGVKHAAVDDAMNQVAWLAKIVQRLGLRLE